MPLPDLTPSIPKRITFSGGASLTPSIGQCVPDLLTECVETPGLSRHLFSAPMAGQCGSTLVIGLHWFGTSDRIELTEPVWMRLFCLAMVQRLPDEALGETAMCLSGLYDFQACLSSEAGSSPRSQWLSIGVNGMIGKRIDAITHSAGPQEAVSCLTDIRDQLAGSLEYADHELNVLTERIELGDLLQSDQENVHHVAGAVARHVSDDYILTCDPD